MAARVLPKYSEDALAFLAAEYCPDTISDPRGALLDARAGRAPVLTSLEKRSDLGFFDALVADLTAIGIEKETAARYVFLMLTQPTLALSEGRDHSGHWNVVQGLVISRPESDDLDTRVVVRANVTNTKPAQVAHATIEADFVDSYDDADCLKMMAGVERLFLTIPKPNRRDPAPLVERTWAWFGNPHHHGYKDIPGNWEEQVVALGQAAGVRLYVASSEAEFTAQNLALRAGHVLAPVGAGVHQLLTTLDHKVDDIFEAGIPGTKFADLLMAARRHLHDDVTREPEELRSSRDLGADETVYHRKIGNSRKFDRFNEGSPNPCQHGADAFEPWGGDKAIKGMARRYDNFTSRMLIHCNRYPDCGMYGVSKARG